MPKKTNTKNIPESDLAVRQRRQKVPESKSESYDPATVDSDAQHEEHEETNRTPSIPNNVVRKLAIFSLLLLIAPISVYFVSLKCVFVGSTAASAITAVVAANVVLAAWVYAAWIEDDSGQQEQERQITANSIKNAKEK
ncbi:hypothetical protein BX070DRAFT_221337 [Coemansia spiralis]|nr:hypothetical protein BX070DRAFT_221337 [Coemansia spiralis]